MSPIHLHALRWLPAAVLACILAGGAPAATQSDADHDISHDAAPDRPLVVQSPKLDEPGADNSCQAQWRRFNEAYACLDPYRVKDGGVRAEGFEHCPVLSQPDCPPPDSQ